MISSYCSPFGIGTDAGGSLRLPSIFNGLTTLNPTSSRLNSDIKGFIGMELKHIDCLITAQQGPMCRNPRDLIDVYDAILTPEYHNQVRNCHYIPNKSIKDKPLKIAYYCHNYQTCTKAAKRAIDTTVDELRRQGHTLTEINLTKDYDMPSILSTFLKVINPNAGWSTF